MKRFANFLVTIVYLLILFSCNSEDVIMPDDNESDNQIPVELYSINGNVQKGPFTQGTSITIQALDEKLNPTGKNWHTKTIDDAGTFMIDNKVECRYVELIASGYYYNEIAGRVSASTITLRAISDLTEEGKTNINLLTTLAADRIRLLAREKGMPIKDAREQAEREILNVFNIPETILADGFDKLDITQGGDANAVLLAISSTLQSYRSEGELSEMISKIAQEVASYGTLKNENLAEQISEGGKLINSDSVKDNLQQRYEYLNISDYLIPPFEDYLDVNGNGVIDKYDDWLIVDKREFNFSDDGGELSFNIQSNVDYQIVIECDGDAWVKEVKSKSYLETAQLTFVVEPNITYADRYAKICIKDSNSSLSEYITIYQKQKDALLISNNKFEVSNKGEVFDVEVQSNVDYIVDILEGADWLSEVATKTLTKETLHFKAAPSQEAETRIGRIRISSGESFEDIVVFQSGERAIILNESDHVVSDKGATLEIIATANIEYTVIMPQVSWIHEELKTKGMVSDVRTYVVDPNDTYDARKCEIIFKDVNSALQQKVTIFQSQKDAIVIAKDVYTFDNDGGSLSFEVQANVPLNVTISEDAVSWIRHLETRALESSVLNFVIEANAEYAGREGAIIITDAAGSLSRTIKIYQSQKDAIILSDTEVTIPSAGGTFNFTVNSNIDFEVISSVSWVRQVPTKSIQSYNLSFYVEPNETYDSRIAALTIKNLESGLTETLTVNQEQKNALIVGLNEKIIDYNGGIVDIEVKSNVDYAVSISEGLDWLSLLNTKALSTSMVSLAVAKNDDIKDREGIVIIHDTKTGLSNNITIRQTANTEPRPVHVDVPGTLSDVLSDAMKDNLVSMILTGKINGSDFSTLEKMPKLVELDMSGVTIELNIIPDEALGHERWQFGIPYAYSESKLKKIILPENVISIGEYAFGGMDSLTVINIPNAVKRIKRNAFEGTQIERIMIPAEVAVIERSAFKDNKSLHTLEFAKGSKLSSILSSASNDPLGTTMTDGAFQGCVSLKRVELPSSLASIGVGTFSKCTSLEEFIIPDDTKLTELTGYYYMPSNVIGAKPITGGLMEGCWNLKEIHVPAVIKKIDNSAFMNTGIQKVTFAAGSLCEKIGRSSFAGCVFLQSISIPSSVKEIGMYAFADCSLLTSLDLVGVDSIGNAMCKDCSSLCSVKLSDNIKDIPEDCFSGCSALKDFELPKAIINVGTSAFKGCVCLEKIEFPSHMEMIGNQAFRGCSSIKDIVIPKSVTLISDYAFAENSSLTSFSLSNNGHIMIRNNVFDGCGLLNNLDLSAVKLEIGNIFEGTEITEFTLPSEVEFFGADQQVATVSKNGKYALESGENNKYVSLGLPFSESKVTSISFESGSRLKECGAFAFAGAEYVTEIQLPTSVETLGSCIFEGCSFLYDWEIPSHIKRIEGPVYYGSSVQNPRVNSPENLEYVGPLGLSYCTNSELNLSKCDTLGHGALAFCKNLHDVKFKDGRITMGDYIFIDCPQMITFCIPANVTSIASIKPNGCEPITGSNIENITFAEGSMLSEISVNLYDGRKNGTSTLKSIDMSDIVSDKILINGYLGGENVTEIIFPSSSEIEFGLSPFNTVVESSNLKCLQFPLAVKTISGYRSFGGHFEEFVANGVESMKMTFDGISTLKKVSMEKLKELPQSAFSGTGISSLSDLYLPSVSVYPANCFRYCKCLKNIEIPSTITRIEKYAFSYSSVESVNMSSVISLAGFDKCVSLTDITISDSVTSIGDYAFSGCTGLTEITIPDSVTSIGSDAFSGCTGLTEIVIPGSVTQIGRDIVKGCLGITKVRFEPGDKSLICVSGTFKGLKDVDFIMERTVSGGILEGAIVNSIIFRGPIQIGADIFKGYTEELSVVIEEGVLAVGDGAFKDAEWLTSITLPETICSIGSSAFAGCTGLTELIIPNSVTSLGNGAFSGCTGLTKLAIPDSVTSIGYSAFNNLCLASLHIGAGIKVIDSYTFSGKLSVEVLSLSENISSIYFFPCDGLREVWCPAMEPPKVDASSTKNLSESTLIYVPESSIDAYKESTAWKNIADRVVGYKF